MYAQVGDFGISWGPPTVPLTQIMRNSVFLNSQNPHNAGNLCTYHQLVSIKDCAKKNFEIKCSLATFTF